MMVELAVPHWSSASSDMNYVAEPKERELTLADRAALEGVVWRKLDGRVLPLCITFFLLIAVDRTNIANARVAGLQQSLAMSNHQYSTTLSILYGPYIASELPAALLLKHVGPDIMLPAMVTLWGVITAFQGLVDNYSGLLACRFFLGLFQGGVVPCIVLYLSSFYPRKWLQIRIATLNATTSLGSAFSGLLAAAIERLDGKAGKPGWAWIFILEGIFTLIFGMISFSLVPRSPDTTHLLTQRERVYVTSALKLAGSVSDDDRKDGFSWSEVVGAFKSPHVWLIGAASFLNGTILFALALFEPTIVAGLGYADNQAQLMSVPPFAVSFVFSITSAIVSDRYQCRGYAAIFFSSLAGIGFGMFYVGTSSHVRYASLFFSVTGAYCAVPALGTWVANNSAPHARRATAVALYSAMGELGGLFSTWLLGSLSPSPDYTSATITFIAMTAGMFILSAANLVYLGQQNRLKAEKRQRTRKEEEPEGLGDRSAWFIYSL